MNTILHDPRDPNARSNRPGRALSGLTILGRNFTLVWRGRGWELVAVVTLLIAGLLVWMHFK